MWASNFIFDCNGISFKHAVIYYKKDEVFLKDTNTTKDTFINGNRLEKGRLYSIKTGDILQFGKRGNERNKQKKLNEKKIGLHQSQSGTQRKYSIKLQKRCDRWLEHLSSILRKQWY